jgi:hypothetical protein
MNRIEQLSEVLTEWLSNVTTSVLPRISITPSSSIGKIMNGFFGINLESYNLFNELGFLAKPTINSFIKPYLDKYLAMIPEEKIKQSAMEIVGAMVKKAETSGYVNVFGIQIGKNAFEDLYSMIEENVE